MSTDVSVPASLLLAPPASSYAHLIPVGGLGGLMFRVIECDAARPRLDWRGNVTGFGHEIVRIRGTFPSRGAAIAYCNHVGLRIGAPPAPPPAAFGRRAAA